MNDLAQKLALWNEKENQYLITIYEEIYLQKKFPDLLIPHFYTSGTVQNAATWLYKYHIDRGNLIEQQSIKGILETLQVLEDWPSQLHVLQLLPHMNLHPEDLETLLPFLDDAIQSKTKFVKAWAYNGLVIALKLQPALMPEFKERLEWALQEEAASIKARIRKALKEHKIQL